MSIAKETRALHLTFNMPVEWSIHPTYQAGRDWRKADVNKDGHIFYLADDDHLTFRLAPKPVEETPPVEEKPE